MAGMSELAQVHRPNRPLQERYISGATTAAVLGPLQLAQAAKQPLFTQAKALILRLDLEAAARAAAPSVHEGGRCSRERTRGRSRGGITPWAREDQAHGDARGW